MEASREFSCTLRRLPPCSDVSVLQKMRMSHFWDTHHTTHLQVGQIGGYKKRALFDLSKQLCFATHEKVRAFG